MLFRFRTQSLFIESDCRPDDLPLLISNGRDPKMNWDSMSAFVAQEALGVTDFPIVHRGRESTGAATIDAVAFVAIDQNLCSTRAPQDFVALVTGDLFRTLVPKQNRPVPPDHVHARLKVFQNGSENTGIV
jgi:hypothetical protein